MNYQYNASTSFIERPAYIPSKSISFSKTKYESDVQYEITRNYFDPDKQSPPSIWKNRLLERIEIHMNHKCNHKCNQN